MYRACLALALGLMLSLFGGCAGNPKPTNPIDPWEGYNRAMYNFDDGLDKVVLKPSADLYVAVLPKPVRQCLGNAFDNMGYGNVILNDFFQGKWEQGWSDTGRMAVNSTIGIAGLLDVATPLNMPSHDNDLGLTLGIWGFEQGPYLVLPLLGPSTVRDAPGWAMTIAAQPLNYVDTPVGVQLGIGILQLMDGRARAEQEVRFRDQAAIDPYVFTRDAYLQYREGQLHPGRAPAPKEDIYGDDEGDATQPARPPATSPAPPSATRPAATQPAVLP